MDDTPQYLRPNVIIEPLVDGFYASLQTVAPVQSAMNLAFLHVPLLESYLQSPRVHIDASRMPELRGGFFVNIDEERSGEVAALLASIKRDRGEQLRFAEAVAEAEEVVRQGATGFDLTPLYPKLPAELSGLVELAYDSSNQASVRFLEPLVYESGAYAEERQSVQLSLDTGAERPFILSTPRLPSPDVLDLRIPLRHPGLEDLLKARVHAVALGQLREVLELGDEEAGALGRAAGSRARPGPRTGISMPGAASAISGTRAWCCRRRRPRSSPIPSSAPITQRRAGTPTGTCPITSTWP